MSTATAATNTGVRIVRKRRSFKKEFGKLDPWMRAGAILLLVMMVTLVIDQFHYWDTIEDYSFGFLVPVFAVFVLVDRWKKMREYLFESTPPVPLAEGSLLVRKLDDFGKPLVGLAYAGLAGSLTVFCLGGLIRASQGPANLASLFIAAGFAGTMLTLPYISYVQDGSGKPPCVYNRLAFALLFLFSGAIWMISTPMLIHLTGLELTMMGWVARITEAVFNFIGEPVERFGNVLILPNGSAVHVEDACSGIRSLTACIFAGSFLGAMFMDRFWRKVVLVGMSVVFAFILNVFRSLFLTYWSNIRGAGAIDKDFWGNSPEIENAAGKMVENPDFLLGTVHDVAGYGVLAVTFVMLIGVMMILNFKLEFDDEEPDGDGVGNEPTESA